LDNMFPACAVHPVPLELRRLVEGISSGPDDSREHGREQFRLRCTLCSHCNRCSERRETRKNLETGSQAKVGSNQPITY
jgi:hypothetical protein